MANALQASARLLPLVPENLNVKKSQKSHSQDRAHIEPCTREGQEPDHCFSPGQGLGGQVDLTALTLILFL